MWSEFSSQINVSYDVFDWLSMGEVYFNYMKVLCSRRYSFVVEAL
jgi:hypothetical protein